MIILWASGLSGCLLEALDLVLCCCGSIGAAQLAEEVRFFSKLRYLRYLREVMPHLDELWPLLFPSCML